MATSGASGRIVAGRYRLERLIGRGGAGAVWRGHDERLHRPVAIKEIAFPTDGPPAEVGHVRALREARAAARLADAGVVRVYDVLEDHDVAYLIMELVDAPNLSVLIRRAGPLRPRAVARVGIGVLDTLIAAHRAGIVHRDVKPSNVLIDDDSPRLTDFGIARLGDDPMITSSGVVMGTPAYVAPEHVRGETVGPAADLYGLGATLYYAVEGTAPFGERNSLATVMAVVDRPPRRPRRAGPLTSLLDDLLVKEPDDRPSAGEVRERLIDVRDATSGDATQRAIVTTTARLPTGGGAAGAGTPDTGDGDTADMPTEDVETSGAAAGTAPADVEASAVAAGTAPADVEASAAVADTAPADVEASGAVADTASADVEASGAAADTVPADVEASAAAASGIATADIATEPATPPRRPIEGTAAVGAPSEGTVARDAVAGSDSEADGGDATSTDAPRDRRPAPSPPRRRGRRPLVVAAVATVLALISALGLRAGEGSGAQPADAEGERSAAGAAAATSPSPDDGGDSGDENAPSAPPPAASGTDRRGDGVLPAHDVEVPAEWVVFASDDVPYQVAHPPGWQVVYVADTRTDLRDPRTGTYLRLDWVAARRDPIGAWEAFEPRFAQRQDDYRRVALEPTTYRGNPAALWEYRYRSGAADLHAYNLGVNAGEFGYALNLQARQRHFAAARRLWPYFLASYRFTPP